MRRLSIFFSAIAALLLASCMDSGYDDVEKDSTGVNIEMTNVVPIQQLKERYRSTITASGMTQITEDIQIKGWTRRTAPRGPAGGVQPQGPLYRRLRHSG